jgi:hypothetical protein
MASTPSKNDFEVSRSFQDASDDEIARSLNYYYRLLWNYHTITSSLPHYYCIITLLLLPHYYSITTSSLPITTCHYYSLLISLLPLLPIIQERNE